MLVYFDLRGFDDRYFALNVPAAMTLASLLTVADVPAAAPATVYVRDIPWPLGPHARIELFHGDLIIITRPAHPVMIHAVLRDMLQTLEGWTLAPDIPGEYGDRTWLVTDHEPVHYDIDRRRAAMFRQDVAAVLDISSHTLLLQPVWPRILNFAAQGLLMRSVLIAVNMPAPVSGGLDHWVVCLLDLRPILLGFVAAYAPNGLYNVTGLVHRLQDFCPAGFRVDVLGGHPRQDDPADCRTVFAGEVLLVTFVPDVPPSFLSEPPSDGAGFPDHGHERPPSPDPRHDHRANDATSAGRSSADAAASHVDGLPGGGLGADGRHQRAGSAFAPAKRHAGVTRHALVLACLASLCQPLRAVQLLQSPPTPTLPAPPDAHPKLSDQHLVDSGPRRAVPCSALRGLVGLFLHHAGPATQPLPLNQSGTWDLCLSCWTSVPRAPTSGLFLLPPC